MRTQLMAALLLAGGAAARAQELTLERGKFHTGDNKEWSQPAADDSGWRTLENSATWTDQSVTNENNYAWYRYHLTIGKGLLQASDVREVVRFDMGKIDDADEVYLNGRLIGKTGRMPGDKGGFRSAWDTPRRYNVRVKDNLIKWDGDNVLAVRVYNGGEPGGMFGGPVRVKALTTADGITITGREERLGEGAAYTVTLKSDFQTVKTGQLRMDVLDPESGQVISSRVTKVSVGGKKQPSLTVAYDKRRMTRVRTTFTEAKGGSRVSASYIPKYILTPAAPAAPRFNTAELYGARPGSPVHFRFGVSGERPMRFTCADLPAGLSLNPDNGALSGSVDKAGSYTMTVRAENAKGQATQRFTLRVGSKLALTPPMGWNSWNCWGLSVTQDKVISSAKALIDKGLADYGYAYMNIDDGWEAPERNADGTIKVNEKFPSMKALGDWLHSEGLKFGIYSSPGDLTCGGYLGSIGHERQDAESYNSWGIDYLKYDWCGYSRKHATEKDNQTVASLARPYLLMEGYLREQPRDIFYGLCQYGMGDVWKWGHAVDANSWRTTGDITDTWESLYNIGFVRQAELYPYAQPGHWNDPDMLIVGKVGWSDNLRDSRLTPDEQYTHITLWTLLASNMLIGCDIAQMDDFTLGLLCNNEVNAVNQDILGKQARRVAQDGDIQIWARPLSDGSQAVGVFNVGREDKRVDLADHLSALGGKKPAAVRDLWRQKDISATDLSYFIPTHGVRYLKIK